jgi:hypothetical protein
MIKGLFTTNERHTEILCSIDRGDVYRVRADSKGIYKLTLALSKVPTDDTAPYHGSDNAFTPAMSLLHLLLPLLACVPLASLFCLRLNTTDHRRGTSTRKTAKHLYSIRASAMIYTNAGSTSNSIASFQSLIHFRGTGLACQEKTPRLQPLWLAIPLSFSIWHETKHVFDSHGSEGACVHIVAYMAHL